MTENDALRIRRAGPADAEDIARLHVAVWRETYADLAPPEALDALDEARRLPGWRAALVPNAPGATLLAEGVDGLAGFVRFGPAAQPELGTGGEVKHLYVSPGQARRGIGRRLLFAAFGMLRDEGGREAALAVVRGNDGALAFYKALGGQVCGTFTDQGPLWRSDNLIVRWKL